MLVLCGIAVAYFRYGTAAARSGAVERLRNESVRMPPVLANAFYFDVALDALFVRPARKLGALLDRIIDPMIIDGAVREIVLITVTIGNWFRKLQGGLLRSYALTIVIGVICFVAYYAYAGAH